MFSRVERIEDRVYLWSRLACRSECLLRGGVEAPVEKDLGGRQQSKRGEAGLHEPRNEVVCLERLQIATSPCEADRG